MPDHGPRPERAPVVRQFQRWCVIEPDGTLNDQLGEDAQHAIGVMTGGFSHSAGDIAMALERGARIARCTIFVES